MKRFSLAALTFVIVLILTSCGSSINTADNAKLYFSSAADSAGYGEYYDYKGISETSFEKVAGDVNSRANFDAVRKLIKSAALSIETQEYDKSVRSIEELCEQHGGYIESSDVYGAQSSGFDSYGNYYGNARRASYTLRIPENEYNAFLQSVGSIGVVTNKSQNTEDVTDAYFDTESRLRAIEMRRDRLFDLLEKAEDAESIVILETSLSDAIYEIESLSSTIRRYDNLVSYSNISVNLSEVVEYSEPPKVEPITFSQRLSVSFGDAVTNLKEGFQNFVIFTVSNTFNIIIWVLLVTAVIIIVRVVRHRQKKTKVQPKNDDVIK